MYATGEHGLSDPGFLSGLQQLMDDVQTHGVRDELLSWLIQADAGQGAIVGSGGVVDTPTLISAMTADVDYRVILPLEAFHRAGWPSDIGERLTGIMTHVERHGSAGLGIIARNHAFGRLLDYSSCETSKSIWDNLNKITDQVIETADRLPPSAGGGWGARSNCPLCGGGPQSVYDQGFSVPLGLRRHLVGEGRAHQCRTLHAIHELALQRVGLRQAPGYAP